MKTKLWQLSKLSYMFLKVSGKIFFTSWTTGMLLNNSTSITASISFLTNINYGATLTKVYYVDDVFQMFSSVWQCIVSHSASSVHSSVLCSIISLCHQPKNRTLDQKQKIKRHPAVLRRRNATKGSRASSSFFPSDPNIIRALFCRRMTLYDSFQTH